VNPIVKNSSCFGANDGKIDITVIGGIPLQQVARIDFLGLA
jgi:hypothetical protein